MGKMECPECGNKFDEEFIDFLENGNPACSHCVELEEKRKELLEKEGK